MKAYKIVQIVKNRYFSINPSRKNVVDFINNKFCDRDKIVEYKIGETAIGKFNPFLFVIGPESDISLAILFYGSEARVLEGEAENLRPLTKISSEWERCLLIPLTDFRIFICDSFTPEKLWTPKELNAAISKLDGQIF